MILEIEVVYGLELVVDGQIESNEFDRDWYRIYQIGVIGMLKRLYLFTCCSNYPIGRPNSELFENFHFKAWIAIFKVLKEINFTFESKAQC